MKKDKITNSSDEHAKAVRQKIIAYIRERWENCKPPFECEDFEEDSDRAISLAISKTAQAIFSDLVHVADMEAWNENKMVIINVDDFEHYQKKWYEK